ncbi:MAG: DNA repair protein RecO, partial [Acidobacteriota bacterium]|nr:DNA repair protein RecO [Acidobacteriota bacterium]
DLRNTWELTAASKTLAEHMLRTPISQVSKDGWEQGTAADLRRFLVQQIEMQIERRLRTPEMLEAA